MATFKVGTRLKSAVCSTEVMVVGAPGDDLDVRCGGISMLGPTDTPVDGATLAADAGGGTALGKRYVNEAGNLELLCVKPGEGSLAVGGTPMVLKEAKPLPSSD
jgi:hypothetical protein